MTGRLLRSVEEAAHTAFTPPAIRLRAGRIGRPARGPPATRRTPCISRRSGRGRGPSERPAGRHGRLRPEPVALLPAAVRRAAGSDRGPLTAAGDREARPDGPVRRGRHRPAGDPGGGRGVRRRSHPGRAPLPGRLHRDHHIRHHGRQGPVHHRPVGPGGGNGDGRAHAQQLEAPQVSCRSHTGCSCGMRAA
ncbi:hypothetical protein E9565_03385 [Blastococcus sp. KM273129]|nr:hypothetical protein [Blastococcus sp. KM273129]